LTPYSCFLLDELAEFEEQDNEHFANRKKEMKEYKESIKIGEISEGMKIDAKDTEGIWCEGVIKRVIEENNCRLALVHYEKWDECFDEIINAESNRIAPAGTFTQRKILRYKLALEDGNRQGEIIK
jgi:hypothetical protein